MGSFLDNFKLFVLCVTSFISLGIGTYPLPFLSDTLEDDGYSNEQIGIALSSFGVGALIGYVICMIAQVMTSSASEGASPTRKWCYLSFGTGLIGLTSLILALDSRYSAFCAARAFQGFASAIVWTYGLSLANLLPRTTLGCGCAHMEAAALVLGLGMIGEICGPWLGTWLFNEFDDNIDLPYAPVAFTALGLTLIQLGLGWSESRAHSDSIRQDDRSRACRGPTTT